MKEKKGAEFFGGLMIGLLVAVVLACALIIGFRIQNAKNEQEEKKQVEQEVASKEEKSDASKEDKDSKEESAEKSSEASEESKQPEDPLDAILELPEMSDLKAESDNAAFHDKIDKLLEMIDKEYYKNDVDKAALEDAVYHAIMDAVGDPYTRYYSPDELTAFMEDTTGKYSGIGAYVTYDTELKYPVISKPIAGSPAEEVGLMPQDILIEVDGKDLYDIGDLDETVKLIKGEEGTTVNVAILRGENKERHEFTITRKKITVETVTYKMLEDDMAYIQITSFDTVTGKQFINAKAEIDAMNPKGLILDLRGNPGGSLSIVVQIAKQMLPEGLIVYIEDKYGNRDEYSCNGKKELQYPMVVLVDGGSASASELLAGAIQDYGIGTLVGTKTFGKGIVQDILTLGDGSAIKITTSSYYSPKGRNIHGTGIEPDITVEFDADAYAADGYDNQLEKAKEILKSKIK